VRYLFVEREKVNYTIVMLCRVLRVSCSGLYARRKRKPSAREREDVVLTARIRIIHEQSRRTYGSPRVHAELAAGGARCGRKRVARLMRAAGVVGCHRRRHVVTTIRELSAPPAPDHMQRQFVAVEPNTRWTADITYVPTWSGFLYLAVVLDVFSRRIVGWAMADHLRTELVLSALEMALWNRRPDPGVIHHSDHGCQPEFKGSSQHCA
jgi:putative transposase